MGRPPLRLGRPKGRPQAPFQPSHENRYPFTNWSTFAPPKWSKFTPPLTLKVTDVEADELWTFVGAKENNKLSPEQGDRYIYVAMERSARFLLAWHIGHRNDADTSRFIRKLARATKGRFGLTTDGFPSYVPAVEQYLVHRVEFSQIMKVFVRPQDGYPPWTRDQHMSIISETRIGSLPSHRVSTSLIERQNLTMRTWMARLVRKTICFSRKVENLKALVDLHFCYRNFCRIHASLQITPAMELGVTQHVWSLRELLQTS